MKNNRIKMLKSYLDNNHAATPRVRKKWRDELESIGGTYDKAEPDFLGWAKYYAEKMDANH